MSPNGQYYVFSGHAIGVAAHIHRLDDLKNLDHLIPTQAAAVLPGTGGLSVGHASNYCFEVDKPRKRKLVCVHRADSTATGRCFDDRWETEVKTEIESVDILEKLEIGSVKLHMVSTRYRDSDKTKVEMKGCSIEGLQFGRVTAKIILDTDPIAHCTSQDALADHYQGQSDGWRTANAKRFNTLPGAAQVAQPNGRIKFSLVREIQLSGEQDPEHRVHILDHDGYTIKWDGFGRVIVGEVFVKGNDRRITLLRLHMGSDGGGSGSVGSGGTNGTTGN
jgi:hypothetical protein